MWQFTLFFSLAKSDLSQHLSICLFVAFLHFDRCRFHTLSRVQLAMCTFKQFSGPSLTLLLTIYSMIKKRGSSLSEIYIFSVAANTEEVNKRLGSYIEFFITAFDLLIFHISGLSLFFCSDQVLDLSSSDQNEARSITGLIKGSLADRQS